MKLLLTMALLLCVSFLALAQPAIVPPSLTVNAGASFLFTENSSNAVTYQWVFDGTNITDATNPNLSVDAPTTNQMGIYWVVTSNMDGSITSNSATLTVLQGTIINFAISTFANGGSSNVLVELFDHDKPATVQNFLHYVRSIAYSNMFFDRLVPGFVLQGGDYDANDRTNTSPGLNAYNIYQDVVQSFAVTDPSIPFQIDSEYFVGPHVGNVKGTLSMALPSGKPNGGANAFYFNLVDNSGPPNFLDSQEFTVFGRVIGGSEILDYFNDTNNFSEPSGNELPSNLVFTNNPFTNGIFDSVYLDTNSTALTSLPVNYYGTNIPCDTNLFFVDFSFPDPNAQPFTDTVPPTAAITYPTPNLLVTNGFPLVVRGTAYDNVGLAFVECSLYPTNLGTPFGAPAEGTTNWSLDVDANFGSLGPGTYNVAATPQDGAGNLGATVYQYNLIVTAVVTNGVGTVALTNENTYPASGSVLPNAVGAFLENGDTYLVAASPGANQLFANWVDNQGDPPVLSPEVNFTMANNYALTVTFISNGIPGSLAFTYPAAQGIANATNGIFAITGTVGGMASAPASVTCQLFSAATRGAVTSQMQAQGGADWSVAVTNLADGQYFVQAIVQDSLGRQTLITNSFTLRSLYPLTVLANGPGSIVTNLNGQYLVPGQNYSMKAVPIAGAAFASWNDGVNTSLNPVESFTMSTNLVLTATFISNNIPGGIALTSPVGKTAYATNGVLSILGTISGQASSPVNITCQLFSASTEAALGSPLQTVGTGFWGVQTNIANGQYYVQAIAQDAQGRQSVVTNEFTLETVYALTVATNGPGIITTNLNGHYLVSGATYSMKATAAANAAFATWNDGTTTTLNPVKTFTMSSNLTLTATFVSNNASGLFTITYPAANALLTNPVLNLAGTAKTSLVATQIVCQLFFNSNSLAAPALATINNALWSVAPDTLVPGAGSLAPGAYSVIATATDAKGGASFIRQNFNILAHLTVAVSTNVITPPILNASMVNTNIVTVASPAQLGTLSLKSEYAKLGSAITISATPKPGYLLAYWVLDGVTNSSPSFTLTGNRSIVANFASNYFPKISGTYNGLFYPTYTAATPTNSGYFTMTISSSGVVSVAEPIKLMFPSRTFGFSGTLPYTAGVAAEVTKGLDGNPLVMIFNMDLTNFSGAFTGVVYDANNSWASVLTAYRATTKLTATTPVVPGRYVLNIPGNHSASNSPGGDSYAVYSIGPTGAVALAGSLADNTAFSQSTGISSNGVWPLYVPLYKVKGTNTGLIIGWQTNYPQTNSSGLMQWFKPANTGSNYPNGFEAQFATTPTNFIAPVAGTHYQIVFGGGTLSLPLTYHLTVNAAHLFTADAGQPGLVVTLTPTTGAITGQFLVANKARKISGAFANPTMGGSGYFPDNDDQTGYFEISLDPP